MDQRKLIVAALIKAGRRDLARAVADDYAARLLRTEKDLAAVTKMLTAMRLEGEFFGATDFQLLGDGAVQSGASTCTSTSGGITSTTPKGRKRLSSSVS